MIKWQAVGKYQSRSNLEKVYTVKLNSETGELGCDCPAWMFKRNGSPRRCKHTIETIVRMKANRGLVEITDIPTFAEAQAMDFGKNKHAQEEWTDQHLPIRSER